MNKIHFSMAFMSSMLLGTGMPSLTAQDHVMKVDLASLVETNGFRVFNRTLNQFHDGEYKGVRMSEEPGDGVAYVAGLEFTEGSIEFDVRGKDVSQRSFVGLAFHGIDGTTFDAVYFRPFNFKSEDPKKRGHSIQYISHPRYTWKVLRSEHPEEYENAILPVPDPNGWFHVRLEVMNGVVRVFTGYSQQPVMVVKQLSKRKGGALGFWAGEGSGGEFANLSISKIPQSIRSSSLDW